MDELQRQQAGETGWTYLEHRLNIILNNNRAIFGKLALAYKQGKKPDDNTIAAFLAIPHVALMRGEYTDVQIVGAVANIIDTVIRRMEA